MAEHQEMDMVEAMLTCSICLEEATDPRALQCQHTYCYVCLVKLHESTGEKDEIKCPTCRKPCAVPNSDVNELPVSIFFNQLKDARRCSGVPNTENKPTVSAPKCTGPDCDDSLATAFCESCEYICNQCEKDHTMVSILKRHKILSLQEALNIKENDSPPCAKHTKQPLQLYCEDCSIPICLLCYPLHHAQHKCTELSEKANDSKFDLKKVMKQTQAHFADSEKMMTVIKNHLDKIDSSGYSVKEQVGGVFRQIRDHVASTERRIQLDIENTCDMAKKALKGEEDKVTILHMTLQSILTCGNQLLTHGKPCDFLNRVPYLREQLQRNNPDEVSLTLIDVKFDEAQQITEQFHQDICSDKDSKVKENKTQLKKINKLQEKLKKEVNKSEQHEKIIAELRDELDKRSKENAVHEKVIDELIKTRVEKQSYTDSNVDFSTNNAELRAELEEEDKQNAAHEKTIEELAVGEQNYTKIIAELRSKLEEQSGEIAAHEETIEELRRARGKEKPHTIAKINLSKDLLPQPTDGTLTFKDEETVHGYSKFTYILVTCSFPAGIQWGAHPHPGKPYTAKCLFGNIPNTRDGHELKRLLQKAFSSRQLVAVGSDDNLNWNNVGFAQDIRKLSTVDQRTNYIKAIRKQLGALGII